MKKEVQPAKVNFFFGPGWKGLGLFISKFWSYNKEDIKKRTDKLENGKGIMSFRGARGLVSSITMILFGTLFFALITASVSVVLSVAFLISSLL